MDALRFTRLTDGATPPTRVHADDAGFDLCASDRVALAPGESAAVPTGIAMALPAGTVGLVCPRSGLAAKHGVTVLNAPGVVDAGYRGEVKVLLINHGDTDFTARPGDRIAQLVIVKYEAPSIEAVDTLDNTDRGAGGFGSTGRSALPNDLSNSSRGPRAEDASELDSREVGL